MVQPVFEDVLSSKSFEDVVCWWRWPRVRFVSKTLRSQRDYGGYCSVRLHHADPPPSTFAAVSLTEIKRASIDTCMHTQVSFSSRFPWFLQLLHRWGVSSGSRATGDGAELCFCFWHSGQEANEEVVGHADHELHQSAGGWDTLLWPAHLDQAPRPREWAVLRPRTLQRNGQRSPASVCYNEHLNIQRQSNYTATIQLY